MRLPKKFSQKSRKVFYFIHLWTGLLLGFWLVLMGLTGSLLSWKYELIEWEARQRVSAAVPGPDDKIIPVSKAVAALEASNPELNAGRGIYIPTTHTGYYWVNARGEVDGKRVTNVYLIDPVTAKVYPPVLLSSLWIDVTEQFHHNLLVGVKGTVTNGFFTFFTLFMLISGIWLWWPSNLNQLKQRIWIKKGASLKRKLYDLHNVTGIYLYGLLFLITLTGVIICYNGQTEQSIRDAVNKLAGVKVEPDARGRGGNARGEGRQGAGTGRGGERRAGGRGNAERGKSVRDANGREPLAIDVIVKKAREALPNNTLVSIRAPRRPGQPFVASYEYVRITNNGVPFDPYTGVRLSSSGEAAFGRPASPGTTVMGAVFHLHYGWFAGKWSKVLYCLSGFLPLGLFITGVWMWIKKKQGQARNRARAKLRKYPLKTRLNKPKSTPAPTPTPVPQEKAPELIEV